MKNLEQIAKVCHEANRAYYQSIGDYSQPTWEDALDWQKESAINSVKYHMENPNSKPEDSHNSWLKEKKENGWKYGKVKDPEKKEHPCFVPYEELSEKQKVKDKLFINIVRSISKDNTYNFLCDMSDETRNDKEVVANKSLRKGLDAVLQNLKKCPKSRERSLATTKLQEAIMWLGMDLKRLNEPNPYPNSYNPENTIVEKTADDLKL